MDYRNILALGFLLLCGGYFFRSLQPANATLPPYPVGTSYNGYPYESFTGTIPANSSLNLLNVPNDKIFIITTFSQNYSNTVEIFQDTTKKLVSESGAASNNYKCLLSDGKGTLPILSGTTLIINSTDYNDVTYYLEGYYASVDNLPYETFTGTTLSGTQLNLLTVPNDKDFIVTGFCASSGIEILSDNTIVAQELFGNWATDSNNLHTRIPSGTVLSIQDSGAGTAHFFLQGYYAPL